MFNLFNKTEAQPVVAVKTGKYPEAVEKIHNEFFTAGDTILEEANNLLKELEEKDVEKGKRLAAIGFKSTKQAVVATEIENKLFTTKEMAQVVMYYKQHYPYNKFITEKQVEAICKKYNLVCGEISRYQGFVPDKNLKVVENFKLKEKDIIVTGTIWGNGVKTEKISISIELWNQVVANRKNRGEGKGDLTLDDNWCESREIGLASGSYFDRVHKEPLKICAPLKDMNTSGATLTGYKLDKDFIPDPVVLQPVKGGYLIVTAWGDEASDENVVNEIMN